MRRLRHLLLALLPLMLAAAPAPVTEPMTPGRDGVTLPQLLSEPLPSYPARAQRERLGATLRMAFVVDEAGAVSQVELLELMSDEPPPDQRAGEAFEKAARKALLGRRYAPAMRKGEPVPVRMEIVYEFTPEGRQALARWLQVEEGLRTLAEASVIQPGDRVAGRDGVSVPVAIKQVPPIQPRGARLRGLTSRVTLLARVSADGQVTDIPLVRAEDTSQPFGEAAAAALKKWRFRPAEEGGTPVPAWHWVRMSVPLVR